MDEAEWNSCTSPDAMLIFLRDSGKLSERKARLFAVACCRRVWPLLTHKGSRRAVKMAEGWADGQGSQMQMRSASQRAWSLLRCGGDCPAFWVDAVRAAGRVAEPEVDRTLMAAGEAASAVAEKAAAAATGEAGVVASVAEALYFGTRRKEKVLQCQLIRDIFGSPLRTKLAVAPYWLCWREGIVCTLAKAAYQHRLLPSGHLDPERLAVLADALEEAGADADLLGHLRGPGPHVRGCFLVDVVLNRS